MTIEEALLKLDAKRDDHWDDEGRPSIVALSGILEDPDLTREQIEEVDDTFRRPEYDPALDSVSDTELEETTEEIQPVTTEFVISEASTDQLTKLVAEYAKSISILRECIDKTQAEIITQERERDQVVVELERRTGKPDLQSSINHYIKTQNRLRAAKSQAYQDALSKLSPEELDLIVERQTASK